MSERKKSLDVIIYDCLHGFLVCCNNRYVVDVVAQSPQRARNFCVFVFRDIFCACHFHFVVERSPVRPTVNGTQRYTDRLSVGGRPNLSHPNSHSRTLCMKMQQQPQQIASTSLRMAFFLGVENTTNEKHRARYFRFLLPLLLRLFRKKKHIYCANLLLYL